MPHSPYSSTEASSLLSLSTRNSSPNDFPSSKSSKTFHLPIRDTTQDSPAVTGFTFTDLEPLDTKSNGFSFDSSHAVNPVLQPAKQDPRMMGTGPTDASRRRTQYYEDSFAYKNGDGQSGKERIQKDSPVIAELKTNVIIKDEYTVVTNLSQHLSERYRRPESAIVINVTHSACLMMAGSFDPAYVLTISAIPSELQPVTNKRNAYLIQHFIADTLHVPSSRGVIRFQDVPEQKLGINGSTVAGEIERQEKAQAEENGIGHSMTSKSSRKSLIESKRKSILGTRTEKKQEIAELERMASMRSQKSVHSLSTVKTDPLPAAPSQQSSKSTSTTTNGTTTGTAQALKMHRLSSLTNGSHGSQLSLNLETNKLPTRPSTANRPASMTNTVTASQFSSMNARPASSRRPLSNMTGDIRGFPQPPPIPADDVFEAPKMSKRKSFVAMFRKSDSTYKIVRA